METNKCCAGNCNHSNFNKTCQLYKLCADNEDRRTSIDNSKVEVKDKRLICSCHLPEYCLQQREPSTKSPLENLDSNFAATLPTIEAGEPKDNRGQEIQVPYVSSNSNSLDSLRKTIKRSDYIDWEEYFMATALLAAKRSKDPVTQVGACLVNQHKVVVGTGYNGMPIGLDDDEFPWGKSKDIMQSKHTFVCHAELNAVLNANCADLSDCTLYVALFPCNECAKIIIQARIKNLVYLSDKHANKDTTLAAKCMFKAAGVNFRAFVPRRSKIEIDFKNI